jgi:glucosylceramidase
LIPLLKEILAINPNIKILGSPWSAPAWMKDNRSLIGGSLLPVNFNVYAQYFVKYIQQMQAEGIRIDAITVQNEPQHGGNNPSMVMSATDQRDFIKNSLGPAFQAAGLTTKIIIWDHNCDNPNYPISILNDPDAKRFVNGSAFHLYAGDISAMSSVKASHPDRDLYFTEQWTGASGSFDGDFKWHLRNVMIGSLRNWSRVALQWNLANDPSYGPFTPGGCNQCKGALTIGGTSITRNVAYYNVAQLSKFIPPGSVRIASTQTGSLYTVAVVRPDGKKVMVVLNDGNSPQTFNIWYQSRWAVATLPANSVGTFIW